MYKGHMLVLSLPGGRRGSQFPPASKEIRLRIDLNWAQLCLHSQCSVALNPKYT